MPIMLNGRTGTYVLYCLNGHRSESHPDGTTMVTVEEWLDIATTHLPGLNLGGGSVTLRCYYCSVCGYVELYMPKDGADEVRGA